MFKTLFAGVLCAGLFVAPAVAADTVPAPAAPDAAAPADPSAWYIIGVQPKDVDLILQGGEIGDDGDFDTTSGDQEANPVVGYVIGKLDKDGLLAISGVMMESSQAYGTGLTGLLSHAFEADHGIKEKERFWSCGHNSQTTVFRPLAGHVIYVGDLEYRLEDRGYWWPGSVEPHMGSDIEKARAFLREYYPKLADRLEQAPTEMRHISYGCVGR